MDIQKFAIGLVEKSNCVQFNTDKGFNKEAYNEAKDKFLHYFEYEVAAQLMTYAPLRRHLHVTIPNNVFGHSSLFFIQTILDDVFGYTILKAKASNTPTLDTVIEFSW